MLSWLLGYLLLKIVFPSCSVMICWWSSLILEIGSPRTQKISSAIFIHVLFLSALPWQWLHFTRWLPLRNISRSGQIQDQPPGDFLVLLGRSDSWPPEIQFSPGFPPCSLFAEATKASIFCSLGRMRRSLPHFWGAEYFQYLWNPDSWCFHGECRGLNLKWIWMSCIMQKMLKMIRTEFGLGTCYLGQTKRCRTSTLVIYLEGFGTANWKFMNTYM